MTGTCAECRQRKFLGKPLQAKLRITEPGDVYEQEADRVAEQVLRMPDTEATRPCRDAGNSLVQRRATEGGDGVMEAPPIVHDVLASPGHPLDAATRAFFEPRFGHDFGRVRVHTDAGAAESTRAVQALAHTIGNDVVFGTGQYSPRTHAGRYLLAHELTHVVQQSGMRAGASLQRKAAVSSSAELSFDQGHPRTEPVPPVDCAVEITLGHDCFALIAEMIAIQADMRENNRWLERYRNGDIPWDADAYKTRAQYQGDLRTKFEAKERIRKSCCAGHEVPGEAPTMSPAASPAPAPQPSTPDEQGSGG
ncbi:MAG: DUF4157 domain-containing protein [Nitrospiraceae bacterium]